MHSQSEVCSMLHVMLDLYGCSPHLLQNEGFLRQVLDQYPDGIAIQKVAPVELRYIKTSNSLDGRYFRVVIFSPSHLSPHAAASFFLVHITIFCVRNLYA